MELIEIILETPALKIHNRFLVQPRG